jgi:two-component system OmpR family response regulator
MMMSATQLLTLVVEDDPTTREFMVRALEKHGIGTREAGTVGEALIMLEQEPLPTTMLLDLMMPDANGVVLLRRIKRDALPIRVAVVTAVHDPNMFFDMLKYPPDRLFKKPVQISEILDWVSQTP